MVEKHNYPKKSENLWTVKLEFSGGRDEENTGCLLWQPDVLV